MTRASKALLRRFAPVEQAPAQPEPFSHDHKVYPQGWSWAMIERESERRYCSTRDVERKFDWIWAVDEPVVYQSMTKEARRAAHELYEHQQAAKGDVERIERPRVFVDGMFYLGASWAQARSAAIASHAKNYVWRHPQASRSRLNVFDRLFDVRQPTLTDIRWTGALNAKGKRVYLNQGEVIKRIVWCCEALADCDAGLTAGYGPSI